MPVQNFNSLKNTVKAIVLDIRKLSKSQKNIWQKVPYYALQADGISGYNDAYSRAYRQGYWAIEASAQNGVAHRQDQLHEHTAFLS